MKKIHMRDPEIPATSIHFRLNIGADQLTDDKAKVTCKTCRRMLERGDHWESKETSDDV